MDRIMCLFGSEHAHLIFRFYFSALLTLRHTWNFITDWPPALHHTVVLAVFEDRTPQAMRSLLSTLIQFSVLLRRRTLGHRKSDLGMCAQGKDHERTQENGHGKRPQGKWKLPGAFIFDPKKISFKCLRPQTLVTRQRSPNIPKPRTVFLTTVIKCLTRTLKGGRWLRGSVAPWLRGSGSSGLALLVSSHLGRPRSSQSGLKQGWAIPRPPALPARSQPLKVSNVPRQRHLLRTKYANTSTS